MEQATLKQLLKADLERMGPLPESMDAMLEQYLAAAKANLDRRAIPESESPDYTQLLVGTAAWMYRKRKNGEAEPAYLRRLRLDLQLERRG